MNDSHGISSQEVTENQSEPQPGARTRLPSPEEVSECQALLQRLADGLGRALLGQQEMLELVVICLVARGHILLEGLPGLGKTELVKSLSKLLGLEFRRIQFTPDLLPGDIVGAPILEESERGRQLVFHKGPVFTNLLLADEINRATPKTQSALLEAMQERRVTVMGATHPLPLPFFVLATQNPIELEGTYPLPEAQLDRFTFKVEVLGVSSSTLQEIIMTRSDGEPPELEQALNLDEMRRVFDVADRIHLPRGVASYIARLVTATHPAESGGLAEVNQHVRYGASPRAAIALARTARSSALLHGRPNVGFDDVKRVAPSVLRHRVVLDYSARLEGWTPSSIVDKVVESVTELDRELPVDLES